MPLKTFQVICSRTAEKKSFSKRLILFKINSKMFIPLNVAVHKIYWIIMDMRYK